MGLGLECSATSELVTYEVSLPVSKVMPGGAMAHVSPNLSSL